MKKKSNWRTILATLIMVLPFVLGLGSMTDVMAATAVPAKQLVTIHKLQYDSLPGNPTQNTGDEMDFSGKALEGAVFTAYDVTAVYWAAYDKAEGNDGLKTAAAEAAVRALTDADLGEGTAFDPTGEDGKSSLSLATKVDGRNAIYLFKETTSPAGVVQSKSADFILGLPVYDEGTDDAKDEVHVYPKNEVKELKLEFTKMGVDEHGVLDILPGAEFILKGANGMYYNIETGKFDITDDTKASHIKSDNYGKVSVPGLVLDAGDYEFYEVDSSVSKGGEQTTDGDQVYHYNVEKNPVVTAHVSSDMIVTYNYYDIDRNEVTGQTTASAYNYKVPVPTKKADDHDVDQDQEITFTITQKIPTDIADYTQFALVDTFDPSLKLANDTEADLLDEIKASMDPETANLVTGVTIEGNKFTVNFNLDEVKKKAGETIEFKVVMSVKEGADLATDINNEVTFDNNFDDQSAKDSVKTYGKKFLKIDADSKNPLADAEFHVLNPEGKLLGMITKEDGTKVQAWGAEGDAGFEATVLKSNAQGEFEVSGLAKTDEKGAIIYYELKEIKAPEGYALAQNTFKFVADDGTATLKINNKHKGSLPSTGGKGIVAFVAVGVAAIAGAGLYFMKGRKHIEG